MIKVENISKSIGSKLLFKNISFDLPKNKIIGLLGANGAGKTSVFKAISGLSKIDSGKIIDQEIVRVLKSDNAGSLQKKILMEEHKLYIRVLKYLEKNNG